jgi:serine protease Do
MSTWKFAVAALVALCLVVAGVGMSCTDRTGTSAEAATGPIDASWVPSYIDDQIGPALDRADLVQKISPVVVSITTQTLGYNAFLQPVPETGAASGVIIDPEGYIVTNNHVVEGAQSLKVTMSDGQSFDAVKWAGDPGTDLAVVQIEPGDDLPYAHFLSSSLDKLELLENVVAVGNALALPGGPTWTEGVISYLGRSVQESSGAVLDDLIQTDTAINPGNSGGPLVNMSGQVVGINTAIASGAENIGFSISTDTAISEVYSLVTKGSVSSAWLGVSTISVTSTVKSQYNLSVDSGALVVQVVSGSPADSAGLNTDDVIIKLGSATITSTQDLSAAILNHSPGDSVTIAYVRGQSTRTASATLGERPSS